MTDIDTIRPHGGRGGHRLPRSDAALGLCEDDLAYDGGWVRVGLVWRPERSDVA